MLYFQKIQQGKWILALIIVLYLVNGIICIRHLSITSDEGSFINYAVRLLKGKPERIYPVSDNSKMPISVLNVIPRGIEQLRFPQTKKYDYGYSDILRGRYITLLVSVFIILLVFRWSTDLYGEQAGLFSAFLFTLCPNNLAAATLVTTDSYSVLFLLLTMYLLWRFLQLPSWRHYLFFCLAVAFSQTAKQSLFHLYLLAPICLILGFKAYGLRPKPKIILSGLLLFICVNWAILNLGFYFFRTNMNLGNYQFKSHFFQTVQRNLPSGTPVPFPQPFVDGLDQAKFYDQIGGGDTARSSFGKTTILGKSNTGGSFWYYYLVSLLFKTPITYFILIGWSLYLLVKQTSFAIFLKRECFLFLPVIYFLVLMSFFYNTQNGLRHIIFIYPFLFIFCGILMKWVYSAGQIALIAALLFYLLFSDFKYRNNYYAYTNELIWDKKDAYRYVGSNNLYFGQAKFLLLDYLHRHPEIKMAPKMPQAGLFVIGVDDYLDIWNLHQYDWINKYKPVDQVVFAYLLIKVDEKDFRR
jgi:Dolichyl-phosphate-mannose-protein mannosyltransferase